MLVFCDADDDDDDSMPVWPSWAVGALSVARAIFASITLVM
jgi:hypothetical protein